MFIDIPPFQQLGVGERSSEAAGSAAVLRQIIPSDMTHSIISLGKGFTLAQCKELVSPVGSVGASKGQWPFEVATGDPHLCTLAPGKLS